MSSMQFLVKILEIYSKLDNIFTGSMKPATYLIFSMRTNSFQTRKNKGKSNLKKNIYIYPIFLFQFCVVNVFNSINTMTSKTARGSVHLLSNSVSK